MLHKFEKLLSRGVRKRVKVHFGLTLSTVLETMGLQTASPHFETWRKALSTILVFWAALREKPDIFTCHVVLQTVFKIGVVFGLTDEISRTGAIRMMSEVSF